METNTLRGSEHRSEPLAEGLATVRPPIERWGPIYEPGHSWFSALLAFLRGLNGPTLVAVVAVAGMIYIGALMARPDRESPTPGVVGVVTVVSLAVIAVMALRAEGTYRNATPGKRSRNKPADP
jgi:hypothetical protein